jgi:hypothetical protein
MQILQITLSSCESEGCDFKMLVSGIKSRPHYPGLKPDANAKQNVIVADSGGAGAVADMMRHVDFDFASRCVVLLVGPGDFTACEPFKFASVWSSPTIATAINRLVNVLQHGRMGLRLYVAGTEPLIGQVVKAAVESGIEHNSVRTEHRGSTARRVQCVHCKGITEDVTTNPVTCAHCGTALLVRDHYSRRYAAFMGVRIDAEAPGEIPQSVGEFK